MTKNKPHLLARLSFIGGVLLLASWDHNPLVRLEAILGLSPGPFERFTGMRTIFSGMTAAAFDMTRLDFVGAIRNNILSPIIAVAGLVGIATWKFPRATPEREPLMLGGAVVASLLVDVAWRILN